MEHLYSEEVAVTRNQGVPYVEYQVAKFWQDVIAIAPDVLTPIPTRLAHTLEPVGAWTEWYRHAEMAVVESLPKREARALLDDASGWQGRRSLNVWYLHAAPEIWFWSDGADAHIEWDNRERYNFAGVPTWEAVLGHLAVPVEAFREEVHAFDARFIHQMWDRIAIAQADWPVPEVALSPRLNDEHQANARYYVPLAG